MIVAEPSIYIGKEMEKESKFIFIKIGSKNDKNIDFNFVNSIQFV